MASVAEAVKATSVPTMIEASIDADFGCGAACVSALYGLGALVLMSVGNFLAGAPLRIPVELRNRHNSACMLLQGGKGLVLGY